MNNNVLSAALKQALDSKKNDFSSFVWKGEKRKEGDKFVQDTEMIINMTPERLKECYAHCDRMLNSTDPKRLGRYNVLDEVNEQIKKCNIELLLRYFENSYIRNENRTPIKRRTLWLSLRELMSNNPDIEDWSKVPMNKITTELPSEFNDISVAEVLDGCIDVLGSFNKQHLTMSFITKMGLWFTKAEETELKGTSNTDRLKTAKEKLHLPDKLVLRFSDKGLSYHEMRAMLTLPKQQRYSDMTTEQLYTLENKILPRLQKEIDSHIFSWKRLMKQFELVAKNKGIELND